MTIRKVSDILTGFMIFLTILFSPVVVVLVASFVLYIEREHVAYRKLIENEKRAKAQHLISEMQAAWKLGFRRLDDETDEEFVRRFDQHRRRAVELFEKSKEMDQ